MSENQSKPFVILISGSMGSGKTTLIRELSRCLDGVPCLIFDEYEQYADWPDDLDQWMREGANPHQVKIPRMKYDLLSLLAGKAITHPHDHKVINPEKYILIEDPFGVERCEISELVDFLVFIEVPKDLCVVRLVQRALGIGETNFEKTIEKEKRSELKERLKSTSRWLKHYMWIRSGLGITDVIKQKADIIIDGTKPIDQMAEDVLVGIKRRDRMTPFPTCKITVLKTLHHPDLAAEYRRPDVHKGPCPFFKVGDEFSVNYLAERPDDFKCDWAWHDIHKIIMILMTNGNFSTWMKNENNFITCCTDGIKPVIFKVERIETQT